MSVTLYDERNPHPAGFRGYRVAVMVDGNHKQRYFTINQYETKATQHKEAHKINATWLQQKERVQIHRDNQAIQTTRSNYGTDVRGIALKDVFNHDRRGNPRAYKNRRFIVQGQHNGKPFGKNFLPTKAGWKKAVAFLAKSKNLSRWKHLLERCPI